VRVEATELEPSRDNANIDHAVIDPIYPCLSSLISTNHDGSIGPQKTGRADETDVFILYDV
jgi:hypothetical protein